MARGNFATDRLAQLLYPFPDWPNIAGARLDLPTPRHDSPDAMLEVDSHGCVAAASSLALHRFLRFAMAMRNGAGSQGLGLGDAELAFVAGVWLDWLTIPRSDPTGGLRRAIRLSCWARQLRVGSVRSPATNAAALFGLFFGACDLICWFLRWVVGWF